VNLKHSKRQRKFLNEMRGMADVPWPARRHKYPGTYQPQMTGQRCSRLVEVRRRRRRGWRGVLDWFRRLRPILQPVLCGGPVVLVPASAQRRGHLACLHCGPIRRRRR
jgi:hypothetical protein